MNFEENINTFSVANYIPFVLTLTADEGKENDEGELSLKKIMFDNFPFYNCENGFQTDEYLQERINSINDGIQKLKLQMNQTQITKRYRLKNYILAKENIVKCLEEMKGKNLKISIGSIKNTVE